MTRKPRIELVSHPLCPFAQRAVLLLLSKGLGRDDDYDLTHLDLAALPDWFGAATVGGRMPMLRLDGEPVALHGGAIAEYLDERFSPPLRRALGEDPEFRLRQREGVAHADAALQCLRAVYLAPGADELDRAVGALFEQLAELEARLDRGQIPDEPVDPMSMFEIAIGPFFSLALFFPWLRDHTGWDAVPRVRALGERLDADLRVRSSRCPDYRAEFEHFFSTFDSAFARLAA